MQRATRVTVMCLMSCFFVPSVLAAETGTLRLTGVPAGTRVYVDGKPARAVGNALTLTPGSHALQLESLTKDGSVLADTRVVQVEANKTLVLSTQWFPVRLAPWWPYRRLGEAPYEYLPAPPGVSGPEGPAGQTGRSYKSWRGTLTDADALQILKEALLLQLDDLNARAEDAVVSQPSPVWRVHSYVYDSGAIRPEPRGPLGSPGLQGIAGLPADVFALEDTQGHRLLDEAVRLLGLSTRAQTVNALIQRSAPLVSTGDGLPPPLRLLTPEWRVRYEQKRAQGRKASLTAPPYTGTVCPPGAIGPHGPHGAKGADGVLPANAVPVRLAPARVQQILDQLKTDKTVQERLQGIQKQTEQINKDLLAAEQIPPALPSGR